MHRVGRLRCWKAPTLWQSAALAITHLAFCGFRFSWFRVQFAMLI